MICTYCGIRLVDCRFGKKVAKHYSHYSRCKKNFDILRVNSVYCMDCLDGIKKMEEQNIFPDLIICDPPYEFEVKGSGLYSLKRTQKMLKKISDLGTDSFDFYKFIPKILDLQKDKVNAYFFCNKKLLPLYLKEATDRKLLFDVLIYRKLNPLPAFNNSHMNDVEYIVFLRSSGVYFSSKEGYINYFKVFEANIGLDNNIHPNQKPLELIRRFVRISSKVNGLVLDCFVGGGTVPLACKQLDRCFMGFEISQKYVDITNTRLEQEQIINYFE
jgi:site-specific DNA-methyltransferase (adenine-specific)